MIGKEVFKLQQIPCSPFGRNGVSLLWILPSMKVYLTWSGPRKQGQDTFQKGAKREFGDCLMRHCQQKLEVFYNLSGFG